MPEEFSWEDIPHLRKSHKIAEAMSGIDQLILIREALGLTQEQMAEKLGEAFGNLFDRGTVGRWERGERAPRPENRQKLYKLLGIPPSAWGKYSASSQPEKPSSSLWHVPYARNPYFTDQRNLVQALRNRFTAKEPGATCQAISGLGGIGKTQLALAYAYQYQNEYAVILWVGAGTQTQLFKDLTHIGRLLHVPETQKDAPRQRYIINEVFHWLQKKSGWLLILDNVEEDLDAEENKAMEEKASTIERLLMMPHKGHLLLTTRSQALANRIQNILLEEMSPEEGARLLLGEAQASLPRLLRLARKTRQKEALALSQLLGGLPLALEQARAYIEATRCGFTEYQHLYETCRKELLGSIAKGSRLEREYKASVATTWQISFRQVERQLALASDVLKLYAYLAPDAIPEELLLKGAEQLEGNLHQMAGNRFRFNQVCAVLLNYSLIKRNADEAVLSLHRLVQAVLQDHMDDETQHHWAKQAVQAVEYTFSDALSTQQDIERYLPHARICAAFIKRLELKGQPAAHLLEITADAVYERGWYAQARPFYLRAYKAAMDIFGNHNPHTLSLLLAVAQTHMDVHAFPLSVIYYQKAKEDYEQLFGPHAPEVLACLNHLALAQLKVGDIKGAEQTCKEIRACYASMEKPDAAQEATTYALAAQISAALFATYRTEAYYKAALEKQRQAFGDEHPSVARTIADLGVFYLCYQQDVEKAEPLLQQAWEMRRQMLGCDHPDTAESLMDLGILFWEKKSYEQAESMYQEALLIRRQKLGHYHPDVLYTLHDLAKLTAEQGKDEEAEQYFQEMVALAPLAGGTESYEYVLLLKPYADFLQARGRTEEAAAYYKQITKLLKRLQRGGPIQMLGLSSGNGDEQTTPPTLMWFLRR